MIVVDASLAAKWVLWEPGSEQALAFLDKRRDSFAAPGLILSEVASALVRRAREGYFVREDAAETLNVLMGLCRDELELHQVTPELIGHAVDVALTLDHKLPDCIYLALAIELDCDLVTCDRRFQAKAGISFPKVRLLEQQRLD